MDPTFETSFPNVLGKMAIIEAFEFSFIGFMLSGLLLLIPTETPTTPVVAIGIFVLIEAAILGSWLIYLAYVRLTRGLYPRAKTNRESCIGSMRSRHQPFGGVLCCCTQGGRGYQLI